MQIAHAAHDLLKTTLDLSRGHPTLLNRRIQISTGTKLHHLTPMLVLVLDEIDRLDDVGVMKSGRDAEFGRQLFDVFFLGFVLSTFPEFLSSTRRSEKKNVSKTKKCTLIAYNFSSFRSHLCANRTTEVAPFPI
jgi:hypothetical protein